MLAVFQKGAGKGRREGVFKVRLGADFGEFPFGKLAAKEEAEALTEYQAAAALAQFDSGAAGKIEQIKLAFALGEPLDRERHAPGDGFIDGGEAAAPIARSIPDLQGEAGAANLELIAAGDERQQFLAGFKQCGFAGALEKVFDLGAELARVAGHGWFHVTGDHYCN